MPSQGRSRDDVPANGGRILASLIIVAAVANLNLSVANVALPSIGAGVRRRRRPRSTSWPSATRSGLAASVLWLGAIGDRYGRKMLLLLGIGLSIPACLVAAFAPTIEVLIVARIVGGISAGMAYPTTLALITALWAPGPGRTQSIALWSALGGAIAALGPLVSGFLLESVRLGIGLPGDAAARGRRPVHGVAVRAGARQRDRRSGRQPRRHPVRGPGRDAHPGDQLRARSRTWGRW